MKFSIFLPTGFGHEFAGFDDPVDAYERLTEVAQTADALGYETLRAPDHLMSIPPAATTVFEAWSVVTGLARDTSRIRIGQLVTCNSYRNPALVAKMASTVDVMSHGRLRFGIGAGWYEPDYVGFGYAFGTPGERLCIWPSRSFRSIRGLASKTMPHGRFGQLFGKRNNRRTDESGRASTSYAA